MGQHAQLVKHVAGKSTTVLDPVCEGRIYVVHLYDAAGSLVGSRDASMHLRFYPQVGRPKCATDLDQSDVSTADTPCGVPLRGNTWNKYGIGDVEIDNPYYDVDLAPFFAPVSGHLEIVGGALGGDPYYLGITHRPLRRGEKPPPHRYTVQATKAGDSLTPPRGSHAIESPGASANVVLVYGASRLPVGLAQGTPWPLLGSMQVDVVSAGPLSFHVTI